MPQQTRTNFKSGVSAVIYSNTQKLIKGDTIRDKFLVMADSVLFYEDANVSGGFLGIHATNLNVDISFIKSTSPTGKFLKDDGTWDTVSTLPSQASQSGKFLTTNGTSVSWAQLTANALDGTFLFISGQGIDTSSTAGSDVLNIGAANANVINYGNSSTIHNFFGTAIYETQTNSFVKDKLFTLNKDGSASSGIGAGFEIEEAGSITGYFKTNAARNGFQIKTPAGSFIADLNTNLLGANRTFSFPNTDGTLMVGSLSDQHVGFGSAGAVTGSADFTYNNSSKLLKAPSLTLKPSSGNSFTVLNSSDVAQVYIDSSNQFAFNAGTSGPIFFGAFNNPTAGLAGFSIPNNVIMGISAPTRRAGFGGAGAHFATTAPASLVDVYGKANEVQLIVSASSGQTSDILQVMASNRSTNHVVVDKDGKFSANSGANVTALTLSAGTRFVPALKLSNGLRLDTPQAGVVEFESDRLYFTKTTGTTRETIAYLSDVPAGSTPGGSDNSIQFKSGSTFQGSGDFVWEDSSFYFKVKGMSQFGQSTTVDPTAVVDIAASNSARAALRIRAGDAPGDPNEGDIWQDGTDIYIRIGGTNRMFMLI